MAVSTLKLSPKGHLAPSMFNRATVLRHTHTQVPEGDCISCSASIPNPAFHEASHKHKKSSPLDQDLHQCLFCKKCLKAAAAVEQQKSATNASGSNSQSVRSSQDILAPVLTVKVKNSKENDSEKRKTILTDSLTEKDRKPLFCGFCRKTSSGLPVRYCVQCSKYLCKGCYGKHQGDAKPGGKWMFKYHATIDLGKIRNPDVL